MAVSRAGRVVWRAVKTGPSQVVEDPASELTAIVGAYATLAPGEVGASDVTVGTRTSRS